MISRSSLFSIRPRTCNPVVPASPSIKTLNLECKALEKRRAGDGPVRVKLETVDAHSRARLAEIFMVYILEIKEMWTLDHPLSS